MLPPDYSAPQIDEQGRTFVVHVPTGVRYIVREHDHPKGHVTTYTRLSSTVAPTRPSAPKAPRSHRRQQSLDWSRPEPWLQRAEPHRAPLPTPIAEREPLITARATFIEGSQP